jgi:hypothetical protein
VLARSCAIAIDDKVFGDVFFVFNLEKVFLCDDIKIK